MKKTLFTLALMLGGLLGAQAQTQAQILTLDDSRDLTPVINAAAEKGGTYNIRFGSREVVIDNWDVLCLPFDVTPAQLSNAFGYAAIARLVKESNDGDIHFELSVSGTIPAGTPFLMNVGDTYKTKDNFRKVVTFTSMTVKPVEASTTVSDASGNRFISTFSPVELSGSKVLYLSDGAWHDAGEPFELRPLRCYIDFSGNTTVERPQIIIEDAGSSAIIEVAGFSEGESARKGSLYNGWYTLTGTRLTEAPTTKGIYIHQGRKVIIK
jgi:hypothetical protein